MTRRKIRKGSPQKRCQMRGQLGFLVIILSPLHSATNPESFYMICYCIRPLPCEIWMFNWTTIHYSHSIQKCAKSFIFSKYLQGCRDLDDMYMPIHSQCYSMCWKYPPSARRLALSRARHLSMDASMTRCSMLSRAFNRRCRNLLRRCDVKWRQRHSEKTILSN